ncbi:MAG: nicotinate-nucleotide--dimethylbenzimidazole phosphoribosyltransferase [Lapillicoccus sp.]
MTLESTFAAIEPLDFSAMAAADARQARLTKPPGSMGRLEALGTQLAGISGVCPPPVPEPVAVAVFAGDHGVHTQGVTPWPQEVTVQMVANVCAGGAVVSALARQVGADVAVVDVGVAGDAPPHERLTVAKVARGTADLGTGPAMTPGQARQALETGIAHAYRLVDAGYRLLVTGDLGLANTTPSAALVAALTGTDPAEVTGRGAGSDDAMLAHKVDVVRRAVARLDDPFDSITVLAEVGGFEHAALAGFLLGAAARGVPVVLDGVIACSAALVAAGLEPGVSAYLVAGHRSSEPGATVALRSLGLEPLLDLDLRLGEGSGAVLAVPLVQAAARMLAEVATFDSAHVSGQMSGQHQE